MNHKKMTALVSLILAVLMLCACGKTPAASVPTTEPAVEETAAPTTLPTFEEVENPLTFFSLSMGEDYENIRSITVFQNEDGTVHVEYVGEVKKVGDLDANIFHGITAAFQESGLKDLDGKDVYEEGEANASMYVEFKDGGIAMAGFGGTIPAEYAQGYEVMDQFFAELTAILPVYVPQPMVMGEVDEALLAESLEILNGSGIRELDAFTVMQIPVDEYFAYSAGLTSADGIASAVSVAPMMMTTAYSLVIVTLEDGVKAEDICADFEKNMDWTKWVCVNPVSGMIATKGNQVLCVMSYEDLGTGTYAGIAQAGWTEVKTFTNPNM